MHVGMDRSNMENEDSLTVVSCIVIGTSGRIDSYSREIINGHATPLSARSRLESSLANVKADSQMTL